MERHGEAIANRSKQFRTPLLRTCFMHLSLPSKNINSAPSSLSKNLLLQGRFSHPRSSIIIADLNKASNTAPPLVRNPPDATMAASFTSWRKDIKGQRMTKDRCFEIVFISLKMSYNSVLYISDWYFDILRSVPLEAFPHWALHHGICGSWPRTHRLGDCRLQCGRQAQPHAWSANLQELGCGELLKGTPSFYEYGELVLTGRIEAGQGTLKM